MFCIFVTDTVNRKVFLIEYTKFALWWEEEEKKSVREDSLLSSQPMPHFFTYWTYLLYYTLRIDLCQYSVWGVSRALCVLEQQLCLQGFKDQRFSKKYVMTSGKQRSFRVLKYWGPFVLCSPLGLLRRCTAMWYSTKYCVLAWVKGKREEEQESMPGCFCW